MIKLIIMARKWQKLAVIGRKRILSQRMNSDAALRISNAGSVAHKGHFVVYTTDERRFMIPLTNLGSNIVQELFRISEEELGISSEGPITVPIDASSMDYIISLISRGLAEDQERALLMTFTRSSCSSSLALNNALRGPQIHICS